MWELYRNVIQNYPKIPLFEERCLISKAQKGSKKSKDEIVLRHIGFLIFRIHQRVFPELIKRFGEDLLEEIIPVVYKKIESYDPFKKEFLRFKPAGMQAGKDLTLIYKLLGIVGATGFEPATSWSRTKRSNQAELRPDKYGE